MESKFKLPTETVLLPSKGLLYPEDSPLAKGEIEMKYMTAKEEDILTNNNYITNGTVIDKLLQSLIITEGVEYSQLLIGDKNAIMIAARILAYGKDYNVVYRGKEVTVDLSSLEHKKVDYSIFSKKENNFNYTLPASNIDITFKLLTHGDEKKIDREIQGLQKLNKEATTEVTTRMKHLITSVDGDSDSKSIREFVDNYLLARDARALREHINTILPDIDLKFYPDDVEEGVDLPIGLNFFWPDA